MTIPLRRSQQNSNNEIYFLVKIHICIYLLGYSHKFGTKAYWSPTFCGFNHHQSSPSLVNFISVVTDEIPIFVICIPTVPYCYQVNQKFLGSGFNMFQPPITLASWRCPPDPFWPAPLGVLGPAAPRTAILPAPNHPRCRPWSGRWRWSGCRSRRLSATGRFRMKGWDF